MDEAKVNQFLGQVVNDGAAAMHALMGYVGDRLGLFQAMAGAGPITSAQLAARTGLSERYLREWLGGMTAGGYVTHDPAEGTYTLPPEHAFVLGNEESPAFLGGLFQVVGSNALMTPRLLQAFRDGKGIPQREYPAEAFEAIERIGAPTYRHALAQEWIAQLPELKAKLESGASVIDVGCGSGRACLAIAGAFPRARVFGFDQHADSVERARANAQAAGLASRATFKVVDCTELPRGEFDLVMACDVVHDSADPIGLLAAMRNAMTPGGTCLVVELNVSGHVHENVNPMGKMMYASSCLYCLSVSLAEGGAGIGALMGEPKLRELAAQAGFGEVSRLSVQSPFFAVYALRR